jgi:hypothetical protein
MLTVAVQEENENIFNHGYSRIKYSLATENTETLEGITNLELRIENLEIQNYRFCRGMAINL